MQIKVDGTMAFMLTMIILGFAALSEPARLQTYTGARDGRFIEKGARSSGYPCHLPWCEWQGGKLLRCKPVNRSVARFCR